MFDLASLTSLFSPKSIAVVGASTDPRKIGGVPFAYQLRLGFTGRLYAVNPSASEVQGRPAFKTIADLPEIVDLAIVAVPAGLVAKSIDDMAAKGIKSAVLFSSGFAEAGDNGAAGQKQIASVAAKAGIRLLGPNCLGFMNIETNVYATFSPAPGVALAKKGEIAVISQSGAFGAYAYSLARQKGLGLSHWVTTGNEADISLADCIAWCAIDPATKIIMAYMEGCRDGGKLKAALRMAHEAGKPVVIVKVGKTASGAAAAASHTAALAGDDAAFDALFRQYGVWRAATIEEFFHVGYGLSVGRLPANPKLGLLTVSGGVGALMADDASLNGLDLAPMPDAAQEKIMDRVPFAATRNPVDITGQVTSDPTLIEYASDLMLGEGGYGTLISFFAAAGTNPAFAKTIAGVTGRMREKYPAALQMVSTLLSDDARSQLEAAGCLCFEEPSDAIRVASALNFLAQRHKLPGSDAGPLDEQLLRGIGQGSNNGSHDEAASLAILAKAGIPVVAHAVVTTAAEASHAAAKLGYPVVAKVISPDILHKSDVGGVRLNISDGIEIEAAFNEVVGNARNAKPAADIKGALIAPMAGPGVECVLGAHFDPILGPVIMFGSGGIMVELMKDVSFRIAPIDRDDALEMIEETKGALLLKGFRGKPAADIAALADALVNLSRLVCAAGPAIQSIDINPFLVRPSGQGAVALDAVIVGR